MCTRKRSICVREILRRIFHFSKFLQNVKHHVCLWSFKTNSKRLPCPLQGIQYLGPVTGMCSHSRIWIHTVFCHDMDRFGFIINTLNQSVYSLQLKLILWCSKPIGFSFQNTVTLVGQITSVVIRRKRDQPNGQSGSWNLQLITRSYDFFFLWEKISV